MTGFSSEIQSVCPGVQLSAQHGAWIPVDTKDNRRCSTLYQPVFGVPGRRHLTRLVVANCTFHVSISHLWLRTGGGRLPTPVSHLGTLYLTVLRTLILLCKPSNATLRLSFFLHTSTFSAFQVSYKNALYKSTVIIVSTNRFLDPDFLTWHDISAI